MRNLILITSVAFTLSACSLTPMQAMRGIGAVKQVGTEKIADKLLDKRIERLCEWSTEGSIQRRWKDNPTMLKYYRSFCGHS